MHVVRLLLKNHPSDQHSKPDDVLFLPPVSMNGKQRRVSNSLGILALNQVIRWHSLEYGKLGIPMRMRKSRTVAALLPPHQTHSWNKSTTGCQLSCLLNSGLLGCHPRNVR